MRVKTVYTNALKYTKRIKIIMDKYEDGNIYVGLYTMNGEPYCDITTNITGIDHCNYVEMDSEAEAFIIEQGISESLGLIYGTSWKTYRLYKFFDIGKEIENA